MPRPSRQGVGVFKVSWLVVLVAATSWVVADLASAWLVPPYLAAMALILLPSSDATRRRAEASRSHRAGRAVASPSNSRVRSAGDGLADPLDSSEPSSTPPGGTTDGGATASRAEKESGPASATASKSKRGRSRPRKASKPADLAEPAPAHWVEVGPGKFVRVEAATTPEPVAGPHLLVGPSADFPLFDDDPIALELGSLAAPGEPAGFSVGFEPGASPPIEFNPRSDSTTPASVSPADPVDDIVDDADATDPMGAAEPVASGPPVLSDLDADEPGFAPDLDRNVPTADGNTPQVDDAALQAPESDLDPEATESDYEPGPVVDLFGPAPDAWVDVAESPSHFDDEFEAETDFGANFEFDRTIERFSQGFSEVDPESFRQGEVPPKFEEASQDDLDAHYSNLEVEAGGYSLRRSDLTSQAVRRDRVGLGRRFGRRSPSGHLGRTTRPNRRPADPRRQRGRKVGRPRQIIRTSPPRSPPRTRLGRLGSSIRTGFDLYQKLT